jgi:hypothetical protein
MTVVVLFFDEKPKRKKKIEFSKKKRIGPQRLMSNVLLLAERSHFFVMKKQD